MTDEGETVVTEQLLDVGQKMIGEAGGRLRASKRMFP